MNTNDILLVCEYNRWANARILQATSALTNEQFLKDMKSSYRSIRDTLTHILDSEFIWLTRWKGLSIRTIIEPAEIPDIDALKQRWASIEMDQTNFVSKLSDEALQEVIAYENRAGETWEYALWQMIHHQVNHSTYHRGQIVTMLRQLGANGVSLDFLVFLDERAPV